MTPREMARTRAFWVTTAIVVGSIGLGLAIWPDASGALPESGGPAGIAVSTATLDPRALLAEAIVTRKYFHPLCSENACYRGLPSASSRVLAKESMCV